MTSLSIRACDAEDDAQIVALTNLQEPDHARWSVSRYRAEVADEVGERFAATYEGRFAGFGSYRRAWWTGDPDVYSMEIRVDPGLARRGIGTGLHEHMRSRIAERGARRLTAWIRAEPAAGRHFAAHRGFHETGQVIQECRLHIPGANTAIGDGIEDRLSSEGLRIASLSVLDWEDSAFQQALQRLWADSGEEPQDAETLRGSFDTWRGQVLYASGMTPQTHWVALENDRPVGMTFLKQLSDDSYDNDYTGVLRTHRRRGIATALKRRAIVWAQEQGIQWFYTSSVTGNTAMITVNTQLGYVPGAQRVEIARDLP